MAQVASRRGEHRDCPRAADLGGATCRRIGIVMVLMDATFTGVGATFSCGGTPGCFLDAPGMVFALCGLTQCAAPRHWSRK